MVIHFLVAFTTVGDIVYSSIAVSVCSFFFFQELVMNLLPYFDEAVYMLQLL